MARTFTLNFPATALLPASTTAGPTFVNHGIDNTTTGRVGLAFSDGSDETAATNHFFMPAEYTGTGTLKVDIGIYTSSGTGTAGFIAGLEAFSAGATSDLEAASSFAPNTLLGTASTVTVGTAGYPYVITHTLKSSAGGDVSSDGAVAGDIVRLAIVRDSSVGGDPTGDIYVACVSLYEET
jgi:hypothetical protein